MKLEATVLAVKNLEVSKQFYMQLFDQKIILDHGLNITFDGGFALQKDFAWLVDVLVIGFVIKLVIWNYILKLMILINL